jgi:hypothetical protein
MNPYSSSHAHTESVRQASDVLLCLDSADRGVSQSVTGEIYPVPITQPYNNFILQKPQALVQGGIKRLKLNEVRFPYVIPNIVGDITDTIWFTIYPTPAPVPPAVNPFAKITIGAGWRTGLEIAQALQTQLNADAVIGTATSGNVWTATYDYAGGFIIDTSTGVGSTADPFTMSPIKQSTIGTVALPAKSLLSVMGFDVINNFNEIVVDPLQVHATNWAPLSYTTYIDIVSVNLTRFQTIADTNTRQNSRGNLICRLFIADENSQLPQPIPIWNTDTLSIINVYADQPAGSLPFTIHRQFQEPKVFRWENEASINAIDISLYDDVGNLLVLPSAYKSMGNFQITFKCSEE